MKYDSRLSLVLHALLHMAEHAGPMTSDALSSCLRTNPVVVRRTMAGLREAGIVRSEKGHGGGWVLARDLGAITLRDVHQALGSPRLMAAGIRLERPSCLVEQAVNASLAGAFGEVEALLVEKFAGISLAVLSADFHIRLKAYHQNTKGNARAV